MPEGIIIPPWLQHPADPASHMMAGFTQGMRLAAQMQSTQQADAALAQRAMESERDAAIKQQMADQEYTIKQQQLKVENEYRKMQMAVAKQGLESDKEKLAQQAQMWQDKMNFKPGMIPGTNTFMRAPGEGQYVPPENPQAQAIMGPDGKPNPYYVSWGGHPLLTHPPKEGDVTARERIQISAQRASLERQISALQTQKKSATDPEYLAEMMRLRKGGMSSDEAMKKAGEPIQKKIDELTRRLESLGLEPPPLEEDFEGEAPQSENVVVRTTKDGRKVVFDATTKKFLRYAE